MVSLLKQHEYRPAAATGARSASYWPFFWLCAYLISQAFTIPVIARGPWPAWVTLSDIAALGLLLSAALAWSRLPVAAPAATRLARLLCWSLVACAASFALFVAMPGLLLPRLAAPDRSVLFGLYQLMRLAEFILVFLIAIRVPLTETRRGIISALSLGVFLIVCAGVYVTYFQLIPAQWFVAHLPMHEQLSGPWFSYGVEAHSGLGMVGFNHGYVALQVLALAALTLHLRGGRRPGDGILLLLMLVAVFMSGSRIGMVAAVFYAGVMLLKRPAWVVPAAAAALLLALAFAPRHLYTSILPALQRQSTIMTPRETEGLSGRDVIWRHAFDRLRDHPWMVIVGGGFGASAGENAHNQYLQFVLDTGIIGLYVFLLIIAHILCCCRRREPGVQPLFWGTIALLITSLTQETFYPVVAFGHFLGIYLLSIALAYHHAATAETEVACA